MSLTVIRVKNINTETSRNNIIHCTTNYKFNYSTPNIDI